MKSGCPWMWKWTAVGTVLMAGLAFTGCASSSKSSAKPPARAASAPGAPAPAPAKPPTHTVAKGQLKKTAQLDAVVESAVAHALRVEPKAWMDWTVLEALPHGARVKQGERLVRLDLTKLTEQIEDLEQDQPTAATTLELAQAELANLEQSTPARLETARRTRRITDEDAGYFERTGRERREKSTQMSLKGAQQRLENAQEELKQLEKMYAADDLTEETEEIVLKRQRVEVEFAQFAYETSSLATDRELQTSIPREAESLKMQQRDQALAETLAEETLPKALAKKRLEVEKLKRDQRKAAKRLGDLRADLEAMTITAPQDGLVVHGALENGKWTTGAMVGKKLVPGGKLAPFEVFMTVVDPDRLQLKAVTPEAESAKVKPGMTGEAAPVATPDRKLPVRVERIETVPMVTGGFETLLVFTGNPTGLVPGVNCKLSLTQEAKVAVPLVPNEAVFAEGEQKHVYLVKGSGHEKRSIKTGETDGKQTEITEGLAEGDKILLKKPE